MTYKINDKMDIFLGLELGASAGQQKLADAYKKQKKKGSVKHSLKLRWQKFKLTQEQPKSLFYFQRGTVGVNQEEVENN